MVEPIAELARRVEADPFFLASALAEYARSEGLDSSELAAWLGCSAAILPRLALCRRPRPSPYFQADVDRIAARFGVRPDALARVARRADVLATLRRPATRDEGVKGSGPATEDRAAGLLMAARDRAEDAPDETTRGEQPLGRRENASADGAVEDAPSRGEEGR